jgi:hypothetical protein
LGDDECRSIAYSYAISNPTDDLAALIELQSTGQLSVFSNPRVSEALGAFLLVRARARDSHAGITRSQLNLHLRHPELVQVTAPSDIVKSSFAYGSFRCDLEGMRSLAAVPQRLRAQPDQLRAARARQHQGRRQPAGTEPGPDGRAGTEPREVARRHDPAPHHRST